MTDRDRSFFYAGLVIGFAFACVVIATAVVFA